MTASNGGRLIVRCPSKRPDGIDATGKRWPSEGRLECPGQPQAT